MNDREMEREMDREDGQTEEEPGSTTTTREEGAAMGQRVRVVAPPPPYAEAWRSTAAGPDATTQAAPAHRFPEGLFVLRNRSSLKALDVQGASTLPAAPVIAYTPKRPTLLNGDLFHKENNQLFFIDWHGCLCAANSGLRVDVGDDMGLEVRGPGPWRSEPTRGTHPPAEFRYDPTTRTIAVEFRHDPSFSNASLAQVHSVDYLLEVVPRSASRHPSSSSPFPPLDKLAEWLPFASKPSSSTHPSSHLAPLGDEEDLDDGLRDDSPDPARAVRVVSVAPGWREKFPSSAAPDARKWAKRQWDIASILVHPLPASSDHHPPTPSSVLDDLGQAFGDIRHELLRAFTNPATP